MAKTENTKKKFDWESFINAPSKEAIQCESLEETRQCLELMRQHDIYFRRDAEYYFRDCKDKLCLSNFGTYAGLNTYNRAGIPLYRFSMYDFS